ncbi:ecto-ADP-ribosyltransferase 5-like [Gastrophryne carolinensis]
MEDAFDDQYITCRKQMEAAMPKALELEKKNNEMLKKVWEKAEGELSFNTSDFPKGFNMFHAIALRVYTMGNITISGKHNSVYSDLNQQLRTAGKSRGDYMKKFHYKALHYYITRALQLLSTGCARTIVYRGCKIPTAYKVKSQLRFGQFASSSSIKKEAAKFGKKPFFEISTCYGVNISRVSKFPYEAEVLIPGQEMFQVKKRRTGFSLESTGQLCSYFNCAYFRDKPKELVCRSIKNEAGAKEEEDRATPTQEEERLSDGR